MTTCIIHWRTRERYRGGWVSVWSETRVGQESWAFLWGFFPSEIREKTRGTYTLKGRKRKNAKKLRNFLETKLSLKKTIPFVVCYNVFVKID